MPSPNATTYQPVSRAEMIGWFNEWTQRIGHLFEKVKLDQLLHDVECLGCYEKFLSQARGGSEKWVGMTITAAMEFDPLREFSIFLNGAKMPDQRLFQLFGIFQPKLGWLQETPPPAIYEMIGLTAKKQWVKVAVKSQNCSGIQLPTEIRIDNTEVQDFVLDYPNSIALAHGFIARLGNLIDERQQYLAAMGTLRWEFIRETDIFHQRMLGVEGVESQHCITADRFAPDRKVGVIRRSSDGLHVLAWMKQGEKLCDHCARIYEEDNCPRCN